MILNYTLNYTICDEIYVKLTCVKFTGKIEGKLEIILSPVY